jgi:ERCC4-type nuclease
MKCFTMGIFIDYRESGLASIIPEAESCNLIHGDILLGASKEVPTYVIERKTLSDLSSSIKDSRFREQKSRLLSVYRPEQIVYIIEDSGRSSSIINHNLPEATLRSAILNLAFKHGFKVVVTKNLNDTVNVLRVLHDKLSKGELNESEEYGKQDIGFIPIKKSKISQDNALACQLTTIPGVSTGIALRIQEEYKTMSGLIEDFNSPEFLAQIQVTEKRKLGKSLSCKIYSALFESK